jgi:hypothetical protein
VTQPEPSGESLSLGRPNRLTGSAALRLHLTLAGGLTLCVGAFCIEVIRALGGNTLSWLYVFEWPFFAGFSIYMWWKLLNGSDADLPPHVETIASGGGPTEGPEEDEQLRAWNRYLREMHAAELNEQGQATAP